MVPKKKSQPAKVSVSSKNETPSSSNSSSSSSSSNEDSGSESSGSSSSSASTGSSSSSSASSASVPAKKSPKKVEHHVKKPPAKKSEAKVAKKPDAKKVESTTKKMSNLGALEKIVKGRSFTKDNIYSDSDDSESSSKSPIPIKPRSTATPVSKTVMAQKKRLEAQKAAQKKHPSKLQPKHKKKSLFSPDRSPSPLSRPKVLPVSSASDLLKPKKASQQQQQQQSGRGRGRPRKNPEEYASKTKPRPKMKTSKADSFLDKLKTRPLPAIVSEKIVTRKQSGTTVTSSAKIKKSALYGGPVSSEAETSCSDAEAGSSGGRFGALRFAPAAMSYYAMDDMSERKCPVEGCNSEGHLIGYIEKHFTKEACPLYHRLTTKQCEENWLERMPKKDIRDKAAKNLLSEQEKRAHREAMALNDAIDESRPAASFSDLLEFAFNPNANREPDMSKLNFSYNDLKMFQDAQAIYSEKLEEDLKMLPNIDYTKFIQMGKYEVEVLYQSPYPEEFCVIPKLYLCEYCLKYVKTANTLQRHAVKCVWRHPPGEEIYRKDKLSVWEVDGCQQKTYCQNLCLLAKFFLDHKTLYHDVEPFLFYIMTTCDKDGCHTVGYFSKEKNSFLNYNVSCILTLPQYQRQGYGTLLIDFSYLLTKKEGKIGSPEKPLSDLGLISYRSYWKDILLEKIYNLQSDFISIKDLSVETAINSYDIVSTLQVLQMIKYWKGKHIILKNMDILKEYMEKRGRHMRQQIDPECLRWDPPTPPSEKA